ncbi:MAG TPA: HipA domain-containing protein [Solirubrobacterales bacterium]|nr:HipA domain-containing protein [Solirubrobacterales bacterium]
MSLDVHLYGERIGTLFPAGENDYRLAYAPEVVEEVGGGVSLLSNALPTRTEPYSASATQAFVEGLLPEGMRRLKLARELDVDPRDGYAMIAEIGRDCAGAVTFLPKGTPPRSAAADPVAWLSDRELEELVTAPPQRLLDPGSGPRMRFALGGVRHKLSLVHQDGRWVWPDAAVPSTHVIKPETGEYPEFVANEMFCTTVVRHVGLPVAQATVETIAGQPCLVSKRFDRNGEGLAAKRLHQENFCQALGYSPLAENGTGDTDGPGFAESCGLLKAVAAEGDAATLFAAAFCNYMLGNGDAHGQNFALLFHGEGACLAPFYDIASTAVYDEPLHTGMVIAEDYSETAYLLELAQIAEECSYDFDVFRSLAADTAERLGEAIDVVAEQARNEGWHAPVIDSIAELAGERAFGLGVEVEY